MPSLESLKNLTVHAFSEARSAEEAPLHFATVCEPARDHIVELWPLVVTELEKTRAWIDNEDHENNRDRDLWWEYQKARKALENA